MEELQKKVEQALKVAKEAWEKSGMPQIYASDPGGRIALAIIATKILDKL